MKKNIFMIACLSLGLGTSLQAQDFNPNYPNGLYKYSSAEPLTGTARYRALNGAMGALGGDLSATMDNPAAAGVFLTSEAALTMGNQNTKIEAQGNTTKNNNFSFSQAGIALVFETEAGDKWKNFVVSFNHQENDDIDEQIDIRPTGMSSSAVAGNSINQIYSNEEGNYATTNISFATNYDNRIYMGLGFNFHTFDMSKVDAVSEFSQADNRDITYTQDYTPYSREGNGISISAGIIGRVNKNLRLGLSYESPKWYSDVKEATTEYGLETGTDAQGDYYIVGRETQYYINDFNSAQKFTGSAAVILPQGFLSVDYTYNDFSSAKFKPENSFSGENNYIDNYMKGSSTIKVGAEGRIQDFSLRAGYRYQQSPYKEVSLTGVDGTYQPYGDLTGYSAGLGYNFKNFYVDAAYNFSSRDRNYLLTGNYYEFNGNINTADLLPGVSNPTTDELNAAALDVLSFSASDRGYATSVKNIKQKLSNITLTLGFRF